MFINHFRRIFRDPTADAGGAAPVQDSPSSQPQVYTPTAYGGSSAYRDWQDPYDDPKLSSQPQPPVIGNKTPVAPAIGEGGSRGQPTPAGMTPEPNPSTTAPDANGQAPVEVKGALSPEDRKYWETKDPVYKDLPDHPAVAKMSSSTRELETAFTRNQQYLGVVNQTIEDYKAILQSGDPAEIAKMVDHFGGEVKFDTRTPEDTIKEMEGSYSSIVQALQAVQHELPAEAIPVLNKVLGHLLSQTQAKVGEIQNNQKIKSQVQAIAKASGLTPAIGNPNERYKASAQANMTALEREFNDPNFWQYYDEIKTGFAPGGMFHAQGVTAGKAFGASVDSARYYMSLAKGQWLAKNMETKVLPSYEKSWLAKQQGNGAVAPPPRGAGAVSSPQTQDATISAHARSMEEHMKRRSGTGV